MVIIWRRALLRALCGLVITAMAATGAGAAGELAGGFTHSQVRLLQGEFEGDSWSAGVQIDLAEGWKTYWSMPGEAGIAPHFDWARSLNVADIELRWPAPARYHDASGETIGYADRVVFPVTVRPLDPDQPVELVLDLSYAVCRDLCVPARVKLSQTFDRKTAMSSLDSVLIGEFDSQVPQPEAQGLGIARASVEDRDGALRLVVVLEGPAADASTDIFVENFERAYFRAARLEARSGNASIFHLPIDDLASPGELRGQTLRLTVVTATARLVGDVTVE